MIARSLLVAIIPVAALAASASAQSDLVIANIGAVTTWGAVDDIHAYSVAATHCNLGSDIVGWTSGGGTHPVTGVNLLRIRNGRLEMIGMSWMAHLLCPLQQNVCGTCAPAANCVALGAGCSAASSASAYGQQATLGPRSQVNPVTGSFAYPVVAPEGAPTIGRRLQVHGNDLDPALNAGAIYLLEVFSISAADAGAMAANNSSVRRVLIGPKVNGAWTITPTGPTLQQTTAIELWPAHANGWNVPDATMSLTTIAIPGDGRLRIAARATPVAPDTWRYEYAILNQDSLRAVRTVSVPLPGGTEVWSSGAHLPPHHSGEPYDSDPWAVLNSPFGISWSCEDADTDPDANALRFGVVGTFSFETHAPPAPGSVTLSMFLPGTPAEVVATLPVPSIAGDLNGNGRVDGDDLGTLLGAWDGAGFADFNCDGVVDGADLGTLLGNWTR